MRELTFTVAIGSYNDIDVCVEVTEEEYAILQQYAADDEMDFEECEELSDLYSRIIESAYDEMTNGIYEDEEFIDEYLGGEFEFDAARAYLVENFGLAVMWPDLEDEEDSECP